jgi:hypothetical protein
MVTAAWPATAYSSDGMAATSASRMPGADMSFTRSEMEILSTAAAASSSKAGVVGDVS